ncbi:MAG: neutral/alkaline non-lysosomal ceramidase N-terminal domain-containing protein [Thermoprotei archaeon]
MIEAGFGKTDITPDKQLELSGFAGRKSEGIHDRLFCRSLYLRSEEEFVIISCDTFGFDHDFSTQIRKGVAIKLGIRPSNVMLTATHNHSSPATIQLRKGGKVEKEYLDFIERAIGEAVEKSAETRRSTMTFITARAPGLSFNRVYQNAPDDSLAAIHLKPSEGKGKKVTLVNYSCHPSVLGADNRQVSADYPGYLYAFYEAAGEEAIFLNGASGDLSPYLPRGQSGTFADAERMGKALGEKTYVEGKSVDAHVLAASKQVTLERVKPEINADELEDRIKKEDGMGNELDRKAGMPFKLEAEALREWLDEVSKAKPMPAVGEAQAVALSSDLALVSFSAELFSSIGSVIRLGSPFPETLVVGYANGLMGYVPDAKAFEVSSYEAAEAYRYYDTFPFSKNAGKVVIKVALELLSSLSAALASRRGAVKPQLTVRVLRVGSATSRDCGVWNLELIFVSGITALKMVERPRLTPICPILTISSGFSLVLTDLWCVISCRLCG